MQLAQEKINFVLVEPSHPGNIGAAARALKVMNWTQLTLVRPKKFPHAMATAMAAGADDLLAKAKVEEDLTSAIAEACCVIGTSARTRALVLPELNPKTAAQLIADLPDQRVALLFGRESSGLNNLELGLCNYHLYIPTNASYSSLNVAAAVQVVAYELNMMREAQREEVAIPQVKRPINFASVAERNYLLQQLIQLIGRVDFAQGQKQVDILLKLQNLFNRSAITHEEVQLLRGILRNITTSLVKNET